MPLADALLSAFLRDGYARLVDIDRMEINVTMTDLAADGRRGTRVELVRVSLAGEHLATTTYVVWAKSKRK
jgi:hypothetical protein